MSNGRLSISADPSGLSWERAYLSPRGRTRTRSGQKRSCVEFPAKYREVSGGPAVPISPPEAPRGMPLRTARPAARPEGAPAHPRRRDAIRRPLPAARPSSRAACRSRRAAREIRLRRQKPVIDRARGSRPASLRRVGCIASASPGDDRQEVRPVALELLGADAARSAPSRRGCWAFVRPSRSACGRER